MILLGYESDAGAWRPELNRFTPRLMGAGDLRRTAKFLHPGLPVPVGFQAGGLHLNPANKGKFTATLKRTGKTVAQLAHSKDRLTRERAIFVENVRHHGLSALADRMIELVEFADGRARNTDGQFVANETGGADPNSMAAAYGPEAMQASGMRQAMVAGGVDAGAGVVANLATPAIRSTIKSGAARLKGLTH
jgi:hypothetical protein